ncbi:MAG: hypothetical protein ABH846_01545 [Patescibacteria group bacterium]
MRTKAEKKTLLQFKRNVDTEEFKSLVAEIRKEAGVPKDGWKLTEADMQNLNNIYWVPEGLGDGIAFGDEGVIRKCNRLVWKLDKFLVIDSFFYRHILRLHVFFNEFLFNELLEQAPHLGWSSLCELIDAHNELHKILPENSYFYRDFNGRAGFDLEHDAFFAKQYLMQISDKVDQYPIVIRIHPEAGQNVIVDFIKKNWKYIEAMQDQYVGKKQQSLKHGKTKVNPKVQERNQIIIQNKEKTAKEINAILRDNNIDPLDYAYISKIIRENDREKKCDTD